MPPRTPRGPRPAHLALVSAPSPAVSPPPAPLDPHALAQSVRAHGPLRAIRLVEDLLRAIGSDGSMPVDLALDAHALANRVVVLRRDYLRRPGSSR